MLPVDCPQCFRKTFYSELAICDYCGIVDHNFNPKEPQDQWQFGTESAATNYFFPEDRQMDEVVRTINGKGYEANDRMIADNSGDHERCRSEIGGVLACILPTDTEHCEKNNDLSSLLRNTSDIEVDQVLQEDSNLKKTIQQNIASILGKFQSTENENKRRKISNFETFKIQGIHSVDNFYAVPGPSRLNDDKNASKLSSEEFRSMFSLELQPVVETHKTILFCRLCRWEAHKHLIEDQGKLVFKCCLCPLVFSGPCDLQKHTSRHSSLFPPCNTCGEFIFDKAAHGREEPCNVCHEKFQCRTLLERHFLVHEERYHSNCRVCGIEIEDHFVSLTRCYNCCHCGYSMPGKERFRAHLYSHFRLKVSKCGICGRRFKQKRNLKYHQYIHFECKICEKIFINYECLKMHLEQEHLLN